MRNNSETFDRYNQDPVRALRLVVVIEFPTPVYLASHGDIPGLPAGALAGVLQKVSSTSQRLIPESGRAEIGAISFDVVDVGGVVTDTLRNQLQAGHGLKGRTVRLYQGGAGMAWGDFRLEQTQVAEESLEYDHGRYGVRCRDIQRVMRQDIFVPNTTRLAAAFPKGASTLQVYSTADFEPCAHTASFGDAPNQTVYYLKIKYQNGWEIVRASGKTANTFTGITRGLFGTLEYDHTLPEESDDDKGIEVEEFIYLELPAPALAYALLTGTIPGTANTLPSNWHLGIDPALVVLDEYENIGADWFNPADYTKGVVLRFDGLKKTDGKKFIETEICLLMGAYMPVNAQGQLGFRRMTGVLANAGTVGTITADDVVSLGALTQDLAALRNLFSIQWAWYEAPGFDGRFLRANVLADAASVAVHGEAKTQSLKFRGLHNSRHTFTTLKNRFDALRDRCAGPPLRLRLSLLPSKNDIEVGDALRVVLPQVRDYTAGDTLDRAMEVQRVSVDQVSGSVQVELFGSTQAASAINDEAAGSSAELPNAWYNSAGTSMTAAGLSIDGSGFLTANGALAGSASNRSIYYHLGDLTIPAGRTLTVTHNVELRVMGVLQIEGTLRGAPGNGGAGWLGSCVGGKGRLIGKYAHHVGTYANGAVVRGRNEVMPPLAIDNDGGDLLGIPDDLRGSGGASGGDSYRYLHDDANWDIQPAGLGGAGGDGGAGIAVVARGVAIGVAGSINTSGGDGAPGTEAAVTHPAPGGSGGGGAPGGVLLVIDGHANPQPVLTSSRLVACYGASPASPGNPGQGGHCLGAAAARVVTVPKSRTPYPNYLQDQEIPEEVQQALADAEAAQQAAAEAQADASAALAQLDDIGADGKLHPVEKLRVRLAHAQLTAEQAGLDAQADQHGLALLRGDYDGALAALTSYLGGLTPAWNSTTTVTPISRTIWDTNWQAVYDARQALLNAVSSQLSQFARQLGHSSSATLTLNRLDTLRIGSGVGWTGEVLAPSAPATGVEETAEGIEIGTGSSTDAYSIRAMPVDPRRRYRMRLVVEQLVDDPGNSRVYAGVATMDGDFAGITGGAGLHRYCAVANTPVTVADGVQVFEGEITGEGDTHGEFRPGTKYVRPMFIVNYQVGTGRARIHSLTFEDVTDLASAEAAIEVAQTAANAAQSAASAAQTDASTALIDLGNIAADGKLHPSEKTRANREYNELIGEQSGIESQATALAITTQKTAYTSAISTLTSYLTGLAPTWNATNSTTTIVRATWNSRWQGVYTARQTLLNAISAVLKTRADNAQTAANNAGSIASAAQTAANTAQSTANAAQTDASNALADLDDIGADGKLHPAEKLAAIREYNAILGEQSGITASATSFAITAQKTAYTSAVSALTSYLGGLSPAWNSTTTVTSISRTLWNSNWGHVYNTRQALLDAIAAKAGSLADWAQVYGSGKPENNATVGATALERAQIRSMRNTFFEDFTDSDTFNVWVRSTGTLFYISNSTTAIVGGRVAVLGDRGISNPGSDGFCRTWHPDQIPFDPDKLYRMEVRAFLYNEDDGSRRLYLGLNGYDRLGDLCNSIGSNTFASQHYFAAADITPSEKPGWHTYVAYFKGNAAGNAEYSAAFGGNHIGNPAKLQANVRYFSPTIWANSPAGSTGRTMIDYVKIDVIEVEDLRNLPMLNSDLASVALSAVCTAVDAGSTATINIAAHTVQFGDFSVAYNSGSIAGLAFATTYYVYCDDPSYAGGAVTYYATTSWATAQGGTWRRLVDYIATPADGGSSSGGGADPNDCVAAGMWLGEGARVDDAMAGDALDVWDIGDADTHRGAIRAIRPAPGVPCVRITTESGAQVECSVSTPVTGPDGEVRRAPAATGMQLGVLHGDAPLAWERVTCVEPIGPRTVYRLSCGNISFAAGSDPAHRVVTHNIRWKPDP